MKPVSLLLRLFRWFIWRHLWRNRGRALAVLLGVALGASVFTSVRLAIHASLDSFSRSMDIIAGQADEVLVRPGGRVPEALVARLNRHPAVQAASPVLSAYVRPDSRGTAAFLLIGFDPLLDAGLRRWRIADEGPGGAAGQWLDLVGRPWTLLASRRLARENGWQVGDAVRLEHAHQSRQLQLVGTLVPEGLALAEGGRVALSDISTFQELTGTIGFVDRIDIRFEPGSTEAQRQSIEALLHGGVQRTSPSQRKQSGRAMIRAYQLNLSILSFAALFVGMFLVYSLVSLNAASRRHELAVLRSSGASPRTLFWLFIGEGVCLGLVGWLAAIPLGSLLVRFLLHGITRTISTLFVRVEVQHLSLSGWELALSGVLTAGISALAALHPARKAMQVMPREVLAGPAGDASSTGSGRRLAAAGGLLLFCVWPLGRLPAAAGVPLPGYLATLCLFVGFALLSPWVLKTIASMLTPVLRKTAGIPGLLAARYVRQGGTRTAIAVGALITAVALFTALVIMIHSFRQTVELWIRQTISGDVFVVPKMAELNRYRDVLPAEVVSVLESLTVPVQRVPHRRFLLEHAGVTYQLEAIALSAFRHHGDFVWLEGKPDDVYPRLLRGKGVVVSEVFANRTGLGPGDRFQTQVEDVGFEWPVVGIVRDYRTRGGVVFCSLEALQKQLPGGGWSGVRLYLPAQAADRAQLAAGLRDEILRRCDSQVEVFTGARLRASILRIFDETFAVTVVLLLIALAVAALGIATTLTVMVLERRRELSTLRAVGAGGGQLRALIFSEALLMVTAGEAAGLACGFVLSYLLIYVINRQSFGWTFFYSIDTLRLACSLPLIVAAALAAALPAVRLVQRQPPAGVLREV